MKCDTCLTCVFTVDKTIDIADKKLFQLALQFHCTKCIKLIIRELLIGANCIRNKCFPTLKWECALTLGFYGTRTAAYTATGWTASKITSKHTSSINWIQSYFVSVNILVFKYNVHMCFTVWSSLYWSELIKMICMSLVERLQTSKAALILYLTWPWKWPLVVKLIIVFTL